jgi:GAF domain-containing protein/HAMP domain-containing protein
VNEVRRVVKKKAKKPPRAQSLAATLAIAFGVLSVLVLLISSVLQLVSNLQAQQEAITSQQYLIAQDAARTVSSFIQEKFTVLETTVRLASPVTASPEAQKQIVESLLGPQPAFRQLVLLNAEDQELVKISRLSLVAFEQLADQLQGEALAQIRQGQRYISPVYIDPVTSEPLVVMAVPAVNAFKEFQGILAAEVNLKVDLWDLIDRLEVGETGLAYVVDRQGNLIAFSDTARVLKGENVGQLKTVSEFIHSPAAARTVGVSTYQGINGGWVVGTYAPLEMPDWAVVTELPWAEAYREVLRVAGASIGITLAMALLAGLLGVFVARRLAVPLVNLTGTATRIAGGEMDLQAAVGGPGEVASLAMAFNSMTQQLRSLISGLEQRVAERTAILEQRTRQLQATTEVAHATAAELDVVALMRTTVIRISELFGYHHTGIFLLDERKEYAVLREASSEGGRRMLARGHRLRVGSEGIVGYVASQGQARIALDVGEDAVYFSNPDLPETHSEMALPLRARGEVIGVLDVQSMEPAAFSQEDVAVLQTLADQVAVAISNARLFRQAQESLKAERQAYGQLSRQAWQELFRGRPDLAQRYDPQGILPPRDHGREEMVQAARAGEPVPSKGEGSPALAIPLKVRGQVIGVLDAYKPAGKRGWTTEETALLQTLVEQLGVALDSARLYEDTQRRAAQDRMLGEVTGRMRETLDMDTVLQTAIREIGEALGMVEVEVRMGQGRGAATSPSPVRAGGDGYEGAEEVLS